MDYSNVFRGIAERGSYFFKVFMLGNGKEKLCQWRVAICLQVLEGGGGGGGGRERGEGSAIEI